jgi:hypothetical protein
MSYRKFRLADNRSKLLPRRRSPGGIRDVKHRSQAIGAQAIGTRAIGSTVIGSLALGAVAIGAMAIGALVIGRLVIGRARIRRLEIDDLVVRRIHITEGMQMPGKSED